MINRYEQFTTCVASLYRYVQKIERMEMARYGLKGAQAQCLLVIGRYPEGITASRLCEICEKDKAAISRTLAELENADMICRPAEEGKRYRVRLMLTEKGKTVTGQIRRTAERAVEQADRGLTEENRTICYESLALLAENLHRICQEGIQE